jgi:hypothetical protein
MLSGDVRVGGSDLTSKPAFVPASTILLALRDQAPAGPVTLRWLMDNLHQQSFGMIMLILGIAAAAPGISLLAGALLLIAAFQMMCGRSELRFPHWMATRELPSRPVDAVVRRAIPILACVETAIYPRFATPPEATKRLVGSAIFVLTVRLLLTPFPLSNILPAILIAFISLAYLEQDGLLLVVGLVGGCVLLILELGVIWQVTHDAKWLTGMI